MLSVSLIVSSSKESIRYSSNRWFELGETSVLKHYQHSDKIILKKKKNSCQNTPIQFEDLDSLRDCRAYHRNV